MKNLKKLSKSELKKVKGGLRWGQCKSYNVDDQTDNVPHWVDNIGTFGWNLLYCPHGV